MGWKFYFSVRATCRIQGPNAIRYENVATDNEFGQGWSEVRFVEGGVGLCLA